MQCEACQNHKVQDVCGPCGEYVCFSCCRSWCGNTVCNRCTDDTTNSRRKTAQLKFETKLRTLGSYEAVYAEDRVKYESVFGKLDASE